MSTIFTTETKARPRQDATIRVQAFKPGSVEKDGYIQVELLEFHPDYDNRMKFRGYALIKPRPETDRPEHRHIYERHGVGFLDEPYLSIREFFIHPDDLRELMDWCSKTTRAARHYKPLIIHKCSRPFPMFKRGDRVIALEYKDEHYDTVEAGQAGHIATITGNSSGGGMSSVRFDDEVLNRGFKSVGLPSIALREASREMLA